MFGSAELNSRMSTITVGVGGGVGARPPARREAAAARGGEGASAAGRGGGAPSHEAGGAMCALAKMGDSNAPFSACSAERYFCSSTESCRVGRAASGGSA